jgi:hypothetical protein
MIAAAKRFALSILLVDRDLCALLVRMHPCGRNASIRACGWAMPGDCGFCDALLPVKVVSMSMRVHL